MRWDDQPFVPVLWWLPWNQVGFRVVVWQSVCKWFVNKPTAEPARSSWETEGRHRESDCFPGAYLQIWGSTRQLRVGTRRQISPEVMLMISLPNARKTAAILSQSMGPFSLILPYTRTVEASSDALCAHGTCFFTMWCVHPLIEHHINCSPLQIIRSVVIRCISKKKVLNCVSRASVVSDAGCPSVWPV